MRVFPETSFLRRTLFSMHWSSFVLVLSVVCLAAPAARGQAAAPGKAKPVAAAEPRPTAGGMHEGIKVHGHWVIEVRRPDGKLYSHTEFENSLQPTGALALIDILSGVMVGAGWGVSFWDPANTTSGSPCVASVCTLQQKQVAISCTSVSCSTNLTSSLALVSDVNSLVLSGSITSTQAGNIGAVGTILFFCTTSTTSSPPTTLTSLYPDSPVQCAAGQNITYVDYFTQATLPAQGSTSPPCGGTGQISCEVNVPEAGDSINVQVTLGFQ